MPGCAQVCSATRRFEGSGYGQGMSEIDPIITSSLRKDSWIEQRDLLRYVPFNRSELWAEVKAGRFPSPYRLGPNTTVWQWGEVLARLRK